jgi:transposase-like protein
MQTSSAYKPGPYCPHCAASMQMLDSVPRFAGLQTFECRLCGLTVTEAADDEALAAAIPLAPPR